METSRFYPAPPLECTTAGQQWDREEARRLARQLIGKCLHHYENSRSPSLGSLYCGGLGPCVYLRLRLAKQVRITDPKEARQLLQTALTIARDAVQHEEGQFHRSSFRVSLLEGRWVGAKTLVCAVLHELGQRGEARQVADDLISVLGRQCLDLPTGECEVLYGRAGALQAILFLRNELQDRFFGSDMALSLARVIVNEGQDTSGRHKSHLPLLWEWHGKAYLGAAHGLVGILQTLLYLNMEEFASLEEDLKVPVRALIRQTVDGLDELSFPSGNLQSSMGSRSGDRLVHWCHGAPGHLMLLVKAAEFFEEKKYLERAKQVAQHVVWPRGLLRKGVGLCHGISGNSYALLSLARVESGDLWLLRAQHYTHFAASSLEELELVPDHPYSLYEGLAGMATLMLDMLDPENARFPFYEH